MIGRGHGMIYIENDSRSCFYNHALEEYYMNRMDEDIFILWINSRSILLGRNQNLYKEVNTDYTTRENIDIVRRISGGGTVFNGPGNINFTFITKRKEKNSPIAEGFEKFAEPVIMALQSLGADARFTGRNDILIDGKKFSGNAQYFTRDKILHHGTLLYEIDLSEVPKALISRKEKIKDKAITSVASRVTNIRPYVKKDMDTFEFREYLRDFVMDYHGFSDIYIPTEYEKEEIRMFSDSKYASPEWTYGNCPSFNVENAVKYPFGLVDYEVMVEKGIIKEINISGDYFGELPIYLLETRLKGIPYRKAELEKALEGTETGKYITGMDKKTLVRDLLGHTE